MRFGISTHLYHEHRLSRDHLREIARARVRGGRGVRHADATSTTTIRRSIADLQQWLAETGLALHSIHAPITDRLSRAQWGDVISNAVERRRSAQAARRRDRAALHIARRIPYRRLVVHLGTPETVRAARTAATAARRSIERSAALAEPLGVRVARRGDSERAVDARVAGAPGRARPRRRPRRHLPRLRPRAPDGDVADAIETVVGAPDRRRTCTTTAASATIIWCRSRARSTGRRR